MHFLAILSLSAVISGHGGKYAILTGFLISIVWIVPAMSGTYLFANRSIKLLAIEKEYRVSTTYIKYLAGRTIVLTWFDLISTVTI